MNSTLNHNSLDPTGQGTYVRPSSTVGLGLKEATFSNFYTLTTPSVDWASKDLNTCRPYVNRR